MPIEGGSESALHNSDGFMGMGQRMPRWRIAQIAAEREKKRREQAGGAGGEEMSAEEAAMTKEDWERVFERYQKDIDYVKTGVEKGRFEDAVADLDELLANIIYDSKLSSHSVVVAFFKLNESLIRLHREVSVKGYSAEERPWWEPCDKGKSLFIFGPDHKLRVQCGKLATSQGFDNFVLVLIIIGIIALAIDSPEQCTQSWCSALFIIDLVINVIFTFEMFARIIYLGFYMSPNAYLQDGWYTLDFIVVITGWLSLLDGFPNFKPFRAFKALKTVKAVKLLSYCAAVLDALVMGLPLFMDVFLVTGFLLLIFGIMGIQLFAKSMHRKCQLIGSEENSNDDVLQLGAGIEGYCGGDLYGGKFTDKTSEADCVVNGITTKCRLYSDDGHICPRGFYCHVIGSTDQLMNDGWTRFDNLGIAAFTLFEIMTLEGWSEIMYATQYADSTAASWYFVTIVLLFAFIVVNLYIAVIVQTFAKIRRQRDKEAQDRKEEIARLQAEEDERVRVDKENRELSIRASNPLANTGPLTPDFGTADMSHPEKIYTFLRSLELDAYYESIMFLVDTLDELYLVTEEDLLAAGWKLIHIRRLKDAVLAPPAYKSNAAFHGVQDWDPKCPTAKTPSEEMFAFLRTYKLSMYHDLLIKLVDNLDELAKLSIQDFQAQGLKLIHARELNEALIDRAIAQPQTGEEQLNEALIKELGGESVGMWRARIQRGSQFWKSWLGSILLSLWYRQDPQIDWENPPLPEKRTKFIQPYQWKGRIGQVIASDMFEGVISVAIILNVIFMSMNYNKAPDGYRTMLAVMEFLFFVFFLGEMVLKFIGMGGLKWYFAVGFNQFDFVLVMSAFPSAIGFLAGSDSAINLSMLRVFRLFRLFKLMRSMRQLLAVVAAAGKAIGNLIVFIFFFVLIFGIFGMQMFSGKMKDAEGETPRINFEGTPGALLALFITMTGEDWTTIMWDVMRENAFFGLVFFVVFYIFANYILMEMFCAVILENFQLTRKEKHELQMQLFEVQAQKRKAAKALADSVDKELAEKLQAEMTAREEEEAKERERMIREKNEGGEMDSPVAPKDTRTPEEIEAAAAAKREDMRYKLMEEMKKNAQDVEVPDAGLEYAEQEAGNSDAMILDKLDDKPKKKEKKNALPPSAIVEKTCFYFHQDHRFRQICYQIEQTKAFEWSVFLAILLGCVFLALDTPYKPNPVALTMIEIGAPIILAVYNVELLVKVVSKGFLGKPSAYINDPWNRVDFAVLVLSDVAMFVQIIGYATVLPTNIIMVFRTLRVIRPLRLVNQNERIQIVFNALFLSLPAILNVMTLLVFCIYMFSILGMGLYMGLFFSCNTDVADEDQCIGIVDNDGYYVPTNWDNPRYSFDNVFYGMLVLFEASTLEGWVDVMFSCQDINGEPGGNDDPQLQPEKNKEIAQCFFIVVYICFGVFFVLNLVMGVMIEKFNQISGRGILTEEQKMYKDTVLQAMLHDGAQPLGRPSGSVRGWCYSVSQHPNFEMGVLMLILANAGFLASEFYDQPVAWTMALDMFNLIFTIIFTVEITIRIIALYPKQFFTDSWNVMDFLIVAVSLVMIPLDGIVNLTALRPFRLLLLFRVIKRAKGIRLMVSTLLLSLPALFNVTCLLFLVYFIFAILGMGWWANVRMNEALFTQANFRTFVDSLLMLARMTAGEGWNVVMWDCFVQPPKCTDFYGPTTDGWGNLENRIGDAEYKLNDEFVWWLADDCGMVAYSLIYYVLFMIVGCFCVINLFVAVILDNYAFMANVGDSDINEFVLDKFKKTWYRYTLADKHAKRHLGKYLRINQLRNFISDLGAPLGIVVWDSEGIKRYRRIKEEVRHHQTPGLGIGYRKFQYVLCLDYLGVDMMPYEDRMNREDLIQKLETDRAAKVIQALYKGKKAREKLGVKKAAYIGDVGVKAMDFKNRFKMMLTNPSGIVGPNDNAPAPAPAEGRLNAAAEAAQAAEQATTAANREEQIARNRPKLVPGVPEGSVGGGTSARSGTSRGNPTPNGPQFGAGGRPNSTTPKFFQSPTPNGAGRSEAGGSATPGVQPSRVPPLSFSMGNNLGNLARNPLTNHTQNGGQSSGMWDSIGASQADMGPGGSMEGEIGAVRNIFLQRAAARAKAAAAKGKR